MAKISLSKSGLQKQKQQLKLYTKLLPSLNLKRMQLRGKHAEAKTELVEFQKQLHSATEKAVEQLPMLANTDVDVSGLIKIRLLTTGEESVVGTRLPYLKDIEFDELPYSYLSKPAWIEAYIEQLKKAVTAQMKVKILGEREKKLAQAVRKITQHVNLFEKIFIPACKRNIQKIQIALNDMERTAVIRSKISKIHVQQAGAALALEREP